jgi:bifunctional lysine-specific demethylase and histidyl-hydroxylase MINA
MTCRFLENLTLRSLVAPVAEEEFRARYWEQRPLIVHREDPDYYGDLFTLRDFDEAITRSPSYVKMANAATKKNASYKGAMVQGLESVLADMRDGGTLVLDQLHHQEPKLGLLCRALGPELGHKFQTNLYLTPPHGKGFSPHWDNHDVFILQVLGSKHWQIEKERRTFPAKGDQMGDDERVLRGDLNSFTLEQGDLIYIPRGFVHAAECGSKPSLHITFGVTANFLEDLLYATIKAAVQRDQRLRAALPLGFMHGGREGLVNRVMGVLRDLADETFLATVVDQYRDELVGTYPLDISGQVVDFFQPTPLTLGDVVGPRRGMVYQLHVGDDSVRLNFGARSIVFPGFFREALDFALNTPAYAIREIAGEVEDEERIVFIERLMQEGLVVRK